MKHIKNAIPVSPTLFRSSAFDAEAPSTPTLYDRLLNEAHKTGATFRSLAERAATAHLIEGQPAPKVGDPVWYFDTCGGLNYFPDVATEFSGEYDGRGNKISDTRRTLGVVKYVKHMTDEEALSHCWIEDLPEGYFGNEFRGGSACEDDPEDKVYHSHLDYANWFDLVAAIVTPSGRWYVANPEGHCYAKYIGAPIVWRDMWPECVEAERKYKEAEAERKRKEDEEEARKVAEAKSEVARWSDRLTKCGYYGENKTVKKNLITYLKHTFQGITFTACRSCGSYDISWKNGPTEKEVMKAASIFAGTSFCGYTDSTEYTHSEWMNAYGSIGYHPSATRTLTEPYASAIKKMISDAFPGVDVDSDNLVEALYNHEFVTYCEEHGAGSVFRNLIEADSRIIKGVQFYPTSLYRCLSKEYKIPVNQ